MPRRARIFLLVLTAMVGLTVPAFSAPAEAAIRPVVSQVVPGSGPLRPGEVVLRGTNLRGVRGVLFGARPGTVVGRPTATTVRVRPPRGVRPATVDVRVRTAAGWSAVSRRARFTYVAPPILVRVAPRSGYFSGGTTVTLTGRYFETVSRVTFGDQPATILGRRAGAVIVRTPIGVLGAVPVIVTTRGGTARGTFQYTAPPVQSSLQLAPAAGTLVAADVEWVTGGSDPDTGAAGPWVVGLPKGATVPAVGRQFLVRPGTAAFPSGLAGTVTEVADQLDETVRVTVAPSDLATAVDTLRLDYSGPVVASNAGVRARAAEVGKAFEFALSGPTGLYCRDAGGRDVTFGVDVKQTVTDVDVDQHVDLGGLIRKPTYDGAFTAEIQTTGRITVGAASTCKLKEAWANAHRRIIPLGTSGATLSFGPAFEFKASGKGTWSVVDRTRTTFAVNAQFGSRPTFSRTSRSVESTHGGELSFEAQVTAGFSIQLGVLDRAGLQGKVQVGAAVAVKATTRPTVCVEGEVYAELSIGVFLDALVKRWEAHAFTAKLSIRPLQRCAVADPPAPSGEPEITSARLPDATVGTPYTTALSTADGRAGVWSIVRSALPAGLALAPDGSISGTPRGQVGDSAVIVDFQDASGRVATTTIRIMVRPGGSLGGGDIQATLRWSGAADLDLHVVDPSGEEIYYSDPAAESGGQLDHDANAGCNGSADDENPVENIFWPTGGAPRGSYKVWVHVYGACDAPLNWHLTVRRNGTVIVDESGTGNSPAYTFTLGSTAASTAAATVRTAPPPQRREGKEKP